MWSNELIEAQKRELERLASVDERDMIRVALYVNNYQKCIQYTDEVRERNAQRTSEEFKERINNTMYQVIQGNNKRRKKGRNLRWNRSRIQKKH